MNKRKKSVFEIINILAILFCLGAFAYFAFLTLSGARIRQDIPKQREEGDVKYEVYLKDNGFYEEKKQEEDKRYISGLVDHISARFDYSLAGKAPFEAYYSYKIVADTVVSYTGTNEIIYEKSEDLFKSDRMKHAGDSIKISAAQDIDFGKYNDFCTSFKEQMDLSECSYEVEVALLFSMESEEEVKDKKVAAITIPLTEKTTLIGVSQDLLDDGDNGGRVKFFVLDDVDRIKAAQALVMLAASIVLIIILILYRRSEKNKVNRERQKFHRILKENKAYIQKIAKPFNEADYQVIPVSEFDDIMNVSDTVQQPIFMYEDKVAGTACFYLIAEEKVLCKYVISFVENKLSKKEEADLKEIYKLYAAGTLKNRESQRTAAKYLFYNKIMKSDFGRRFIERLVEVSTGTETSRKCIICDDYEAKDGIICNKCKDKMFNGSITHIS